MLSLSSIDHQKIWVKIKYIKYAHFCLGLNIHLEINFLHKECQALIPGNARWICQVADCILDPFFGLDFTDVMAQPVCSANNSERITAIGMEKALRFKPDFHSNYLLSSQVH